jgi:hypothetical protein
MQNFVAPTSEEFSISGAWGLLTSVDLHGCQPETISDSDEIRRFTSELCKRLAVKPFGEPQVIEFGDDPRIHGYSLTQLIESSLVSGHFAEQTSSVYLDIFSCKYYDPAEMVRFSREFFVAGEIEAVAVLRGCSPDLPPGLREQFERRNIILQPARERAA